MSMKITILLVILVIIAEGNIITNNIESGENSNSIYTYEEGHPFGALGVSRGIISTCDTNFGGSDVKYGDIIMDANCNSNNENWNNSKFEDYKDILLFFVQTRLFILMSFFMLILAGMIMAVEMLL